MIASDRLAIGVTGHRVLAEIDRIEKGVDESLDGLRRRFPGRSLTVVSSLAEGSDRLVTRWAMERYGARLIAVLPLSRDDYGRDFTSERSKQEFQALLERASETVGPMPAAAREQAYEQAGRTMLDRSDVVLAIWDGQSAQGQGGTAEIVALARARALPLVWILAGNRRPGTMEATTLGAEQGRVTWERL